MLLWSADESSLPISISDFDPGCPASAIIPAMDTPSTSATLIAVSSLVQVIVASPNPRIIVSALSTFNGLSMSYNPGVRIKFFPSANA